MRLLLIAEGSTKWQRFIRRWGVSFLIGEDVLFDTFGDSGVFLNNLRQFNVNPAKIKHVILSHDDWDHTAGLWKLIPNRKDITVYICPGFTQETKEKITSFGVKLVETEGTTRIKDNIYCAGELSGESKGRRISEQSVAIRTDDGFAVICGCAHPGVVNIVQHVKESFHESVRLVIGGFHLKDNTEETNFEIIKKLKEFGMRSIAPMHCTGKQATRVMNEVFGDGFLKISEGGSIEL